MEPLGPEHVDPELDALLRRARPEPDGAWVRTTGEGLFPAAPQRRSWPALRLGTATAVGLAAVATTLSLAGVGPLSGTDDTVQAKDDCRTVTVTRTERVPELVTKKRGGLRVIYKNKPVRTSELRCR